MSARPRRRPMVVAHRGASDAAPEHTLAAYQQAIDDGADALECDVRLTADGHLVCVHDRRVERTSNGTGVLSTLELADLEELDFGSWKGQSDDAEAPDTVTANGVDRIRVLTLERLLDLVLAAPRPVELAIETKHPTRYAGLVERRLAALLADYDLDGEPWEDPPRVRMMSFSELALRRMRRLAPELPLVYLMERVPLQYRTGLLPKGIRIAGPSIEVLRVHPRYVERVHAQGGAVHVWTVDEDDDVDLCQELGVDAIITNRPARVRERIGA